jgi:PAS domain S-box-containing protein
VNPKLRILNLEDDESDAELNKAMLAARWPQCELQRVETRQNYLAALEQGNFDLILSDFTMPGFNGMEALAMARNRLPQIPFLFVSGTIGEDTAIEALKNGATDYVLKHRLMRLIPAVDRALREAEERAECKRAEETMRQSEHKYRVLFESLSDAAFLVDEASGRVLDVNPSAGKMLGYQRGEMLGSNQNVFLTLDQVNPNAAQPMECRMICADGSRIPVWVRNSWLKLYDRDLVLRLCREIISK